MTASFVFRKALGNHFSKNTIGNSGSGSSCSKAQIYLIRKLLPVDFHSAEDSRKRNDTGSLAVIIEYGKSLLVCLQNLCGVRSAEIFKVEI